MNLIQYKNHGGLGTITINRMEKANALSRVMVEKFSKILDTVASDIDMRVLVITGAGDRVFCAGADLSELASETNTRSNAEAFDEVWDGLTEKISALPFLTIAALNGTCAGGGLSLALSCDIRIATENAHLFYPALRNGVVPAAADLRRFHALIGPSKTKMLMMVTMLVY